MDMSVTELMDEWQSGSRPEPMPTGDFTARTLASFLLYEQGGDLGAAKAYLQNIRDRHALDRMGRWDLAIVGARAILENLLAVPLTERSRLILLRHGMTADPENLQMAENVRLPAQGREQIESAAEIIDRLVNGSLLRAFVSPRPRVIETLAIVGRHKPCPCYQLSLRTVQGFNGLRDAWAYGLARASGGIILVVSHQPDLLAVAKAVSAACQRSDETDLELGYGELCVIQPNGRRARYNAP